MKSHTDSSDACKCQGCGNGCSREKRNASGEKKPPGFFAARPWIWIVVGYLLMVGALGAMVTIAVTHPQADVLLIHGR